MHEVIQEIRNVPIAENMRLLDQAQKIAILSAPERPVSTVPAEVQALMPHYQSRETKKNAGIRYMGQW